MVAKEPNSLLQEIKQEDDDKHNNENSCKGWIHALSLASSNRESFQGSVLHGDRPFDLCHRDIGKAVRMRFDEVLLLPNARVIIVDQNADSLMSPLALLCSVMVCNKTDGADEDHRNPEHDGRENKEAEALPEIL